MCLVPLWCYRVPLRLALDSRLQASSALVFQVLSVKDVKLFSTVREVGNPRISCVEFLYFCSTGSASEISAGYEGTGTSIEF